MKNMVRLLLVHIVALVMGSGSVFGAVPDGFSSPLGFSAWKEHQIVRSQNEVVRITNKLLLSERGDYQLVGEEMASKRIFNPELEAAGQSPVRLRLKRAQQSLEIAKELDFHDYLEVHLQKLSGDDGSLKLWIQKLTLDELAQAFKYLNQHAATAPSAPSAADLKR